MATPYLGMTKIILDFVALGGFETQLRIALIFV